MSDSIVSLVAGDLRAIFWPSSGMLGASLCYRGEELLRRIEDLESAKRKGSTAGIPLLYPWANRLASLHYQAAGHAVDLDSRSALLHFDDRGLPMHGVPWSQLKWAIVEAQQDFLLARLDWNNTDLLQIFPFPQSIQIAIKVTTVDSLALETTVFANANSPVPISFGFHPYFGIPHLPRAQWRLRLPAMQKLLLDSCGIPTGVQEPCTDVDTVLREFSFDDGFALNQGQSSFLLSGGGYKITVTFLDGFPYAQVFAPKEKEFIALEPMTAPTNALCSSESLRILEPGEQFEASFRITVGPDT